MATIRVANTAENSLNFEIYAGEKSREFIMKDSSVDRVINCPIIKTITILGVHAYMETNKLITACAFTEVDAKDWEYIQKMHANNYFIKNKIVFAGKNETETLAIVRAAEMKEFKTGTEKYDASIGKIA